MPVPGTSMIHAHRITGGGDRHESPGVQEMMLSRGASLRYSYRHSVGSATVPPLTMHFSLPFDLKSFQIQTLLSGFQLYHVKECKISELGFGKH